MAYIYDIPSEAFEPRTGDTGSVATPSVSSVSQAIRNEEDEEKLNKKQELSDWLRGRADMRKAILRKGVSTKEQDQAEVRKSRLADVARGALEQMGKNPDKIKNTTDDEIITRLVGSVNGTDTQKLNAVNDYIQNGGYAEDVFNYLAGNTENIYDKGEEEKNGAQRFMDKVKGTFLGNAAMNAITTPARSMAGLSNLLEDNVKYGDKTIAQQNKDSDLAGLGNIIGNASEERYQQYKNGELKSKWYQSYNEAEMPQNIGAIGSKVGLPSYTNELDFYKSYDEAKEKGFDGGVEEYGQYLYKMADDTYTKTADKVREFIDKEVADPDAPGSGLGKFIGEMVELWAMPELKVKYLSRVPGIGKAISKGSEMASKYTKPIKEAVSKVPVLGKQAVKFAENAGDLAGEGVEYQLIQDAYNADLSDLSDYERMAKWNMVLGGIIRGIGDKFSGLSSKQQEAFTNKTTQEVKEMNKVTDNRIAKNNQTDTPYTRIVNILKDAKQKLTTKRAESGKALQKTRQQLQFKEGQKYTLQDAENQINKSLSSLGKYSSQGKGKRDANSVPKISLTDGLKIENPDKLNLFARVETNSAGNVKTVNLGDMIQKVWDSTIGVGKKPNATTMEQFLRKLQKEVHMDYAGGEDNMIAILRKGVDTAWNKFNKTLTSQSKKSLGSARGESKGVINVDKTFDEMIGRLDGSIGVGSAEKVSKDSSKASIEQLFTAVKDEVGIDLNNELGAWITTLSLRDPKLAEELIAKIYPSQPGAIEFVTKNIMNAFRKNSAKKYTKDASQTAWSKMSEVLPSKVGYEMGRESK